MHHDSLEIQSTPIKLVARHYLSHSVCHASQSTHLAHVTRDISCVTPRFIMNPLCNRQWFIFVVTRRVLFWQSLFKGNQRYDACFRCRWPRAQSPEWTKEAVPPSSASFHFCCHRASVVFTIFFQRKSEVWWVQLCDGVYISTSQQSSLLWKWHGDQYMYLI